MDESRPAINGSLSLAGIELNEVVYPPGYRQLRHHHPSTSVSLVYRGSLVERVGSHEELAEALSVVLKPAGVEHADIVGPRGAATLRLVLDDAVIDSLAGSEPCIEGWEWLHAGEPARLFLELLRLYRGSRLEQGGRRSEEWSGERGRLDSTRGERRIEALIFDLLSSLQEDPRRGPSLSPPPWLLRVADEIDACYADGPRVCDLAKREGLHPVSLARLFRRHFRTSISERLQSRRVQAAASLLADSRRSIATIACETGFADQSHLSRVFRSGTGLTPGRYRRLAQAA